MPRAFDEREREAIDEQLRAAGRKLFSTLGIAKTSIDQLIGAAGIAKGSFYQFYESKELLFMTLLEETEDRVRTPLLEGKSSSRKVFETKVRTLFEALCDDPLMRVMAREEEALALARKLPPSTLLAHQAKDHAFLNHLIKRWNQRRPKPHRDIVAARMTTLVLLSLNQDFVGERLFPHAVDAAIASLGDSLF